MEGEPFTAPSVPTPLPAGNEIAAVWASNLAYPRGHAQKFKSQLADSYSKIPLEEYEKKHRRVSGDQILAVLDLPNLATSDVARSDQASQVFIIEILRVKNFRDRKNFCV